MTTIKKYLGAFAMAAVLLPAGACTGGTIGVRFHDRPNRDYHVWNQHEDVVFRGYWSTQHRGDNRTFRQLNRREQDEYWNWRHSHPD